MIRGYLYSLLAVMLWSGNFVIANEASSAISPIELAFYRWLIAFVVLLPFASKAFIKARHTIKDKSSGIRLLMASLMGVSALNTLIYMAGKSTPSVDLSLISVTSPAFIVEIHWLVLRKRVRPVTWLGVGMAMAGCVWLIGVGSLSSLAGPGVLEGELLMVAASITFAIYTVVQRVPEGMADAEYLLLMIFAGLLGLLPFYLLHGALWGWSPMTLGTGLYALYLGVFASLVAFYLWNKSVRIMGATRTGVSYYALPCFVYLIDYAMGRRGVSGAVLGSFVLILGGALIIHKSSKPMSAPQ